MLNTHKKTILIHISSNSYYNNLFVPNFSDNRTEPFIELRQSLENLGYTLEKANGQSLHDISQVIFWDSIYTGKNPIRIIKDKKALIWKNNLKKQGIKPVLILWEGPANRSINKKDHSGFDRILTWNDSWVDNIRYFKFRLPIPTRWPNVNEVPFNKKKLLVNISYNKFSTHPNELYSERIKTIKYFDEYYSDEFDLFGFGWNVKMPTAKQIISTMFPQFAHHSFKTYRGTVKNKWEVFPNYKFGLCYENIKSEYGYITEKIFDCMRSNCVPIYWGAPNINDYVDKDAFINRNNFGSNKDLDIFLSSITEQDYNKYIEAGQQYLRGEKFKLFLSENFVNTIVKVLDLKKDNNC